MRALLIAFATYTRIPLPRCGWSGRDARYAICAFPLVGVLIGAAELFLLWGARELRFPPAALVCLLIALPILLTGGIHIDGLIDTADARSSYGEREKKLEILKDPHIGAFGMIRLVLWLLLLGSGLYCLLAQELTRRELLSAALLPVLSRCASGLCAELLPRARRDGMLAGMLGTEREKLPPLLLAAELLIAAGAALWLSVLRAAAVLGGIGLLTLYYRRMALREFGGVTGDLAGWYLCVAELVGVWALVLAGYIPVG